MPIVSISEAARLTGKSRKTLYRHIDTGRLSLCDTVSGGSGIEISELIRVYGELKIPNDTVGQTVSTTQRDTGKDTGVNNGNSDDPTQLKYELSLVKAELEAEKRRVQDKQETIDTLKTALKLLEHRHDKNSINIPEQKNNVSEPTKNAVNVEIKKPFIRQVMNFFKI